MLYIFQVKKKEKSENKSLNEEGLELDLAISRKKVYIAEICQMQFTFSQETEINKSL